MGIEDLQRIRHSLVCKSYYRAKLGWTQRKLFKMKVLRCLKNAMLRLVFANTMFHKRAILLNL